MVRESKERWMLIACAALITMALFLTWLLFTPISRSWQNTLPRLLGGCACEGSDDSTLTAADREG